MKKYIVYILQTNFLYFLIIFSRGGYWDGGFQLGFGSLNGLRGVESMSLKKCFKRKARLKLENSLRIVLVEGREDGGTYLRPKLSNWVSFSVRECLDKLWILLSIRRVLFSGFQNFLRSLLLLDFFWCGRKGKMYLFYLAT